MTREEIDTLWQQALQESVAAGEQFTRYRFAALVISRHVKETRVKPTASQLEIFQQLAYQHGGIGDLCGTEFEFAALVAQHEREACAKIVETLWAVPNNGMATEEQAYGERCADVIRARGQKQ